ncbi:nectin-2 isoform X2 [Salminus brasiliensis]|uniref:nectin-2 isoform X2 n=1 Tax=Salminus brasiliensis TaxID=930266 RepID=UPI003B831299
MVRGSPLSSLGLLSSVFFLLLQGSLAQRVKVEPEVVSYPGQSVNLRCQFQDQGKNELTQVSWIYETAAGARTNIAVFHPILGFSYPTTSPVYGRVSFTAEPPQLDSPTIQLTDIKMSDEGRYICEYATYPSGNEQGVTTLIILAKPVNSASTVTVQAGTAPVVVARCKSANGRPAATISWVTSLGGTGTPPTKTDNADNTVTVQSEYQLVPTSADNGKDISCVVSHRTMSSPETFPMKLVIEYPPQVQIVGYDNNWYLGRTNAALTCQAQGNPPPTMVTWRTMSGLMPDTVQVTENKLTVLKVDETVNATFICEVRNSLGTGRDQVSVMVRETRLTEKGAATGGIIGAIIGLLLLLAIVVTVVFLIRRQRRNKDSDAPPSHKPPPPMKSTMTSDRTEPTLTMDPMSHESPLMYYETQKTEPMTDLDSYHDEYDDVAQEHPLDHSAPFGLEEGEMVDDGYLYPNEEQQTPSVSRVDSFVSPAVIV